MKSILTTTLLALLLLSCTGNTITLTQAEEAVLGAIDFEKDIAIELKGEFAAEFAKSEVIAYSYNAETQEFSETSQLNNAITFKVDEKEYVNYTMQNQRKIREYERKGYLVFLSEMNFGYDKDEVTILKSNDQFDIIKAVQTSGINYDHYNKDVIEKLKEWDNKYPFVITGAGYDWINAEFIEQPDDMFAFAQEVFEFCPDVVWQGADSVETLADIMAESNTLYLWWD